MWDGLFVLLSLCVVMGVASFLAGSLPLSFGLSQNHSRLISAIGTGLLTGTCLIIIIPEGIETLYDAHSRDIPSNLHVRQTSSHASEETQYEPHAWVGLCLVVGFVVMYLIDQLPRQAASASDQRKPLHISLANLSQGLHRAVSPNRTDDGEVSEEHLDGPSAASSSATTIGLVIHAAADGIALAASSFLSESATGFVVFLALMIHKAPAAFGLTSVLLKQGFTKRQARAHLIVFSLAAPVGALATWALVNLVAGGEIEGEEGTKFATGLLLLFSGGTFLYVAMHTMQEGGLEDHDHGSNGFADSTHYHTARSRQAADKQPTFRDTMLVVLGMFLPLLAQVGHTH